MESQGITIQVKAFCEYYFFVLFTVLNVVPAFEFEHSDGDSNESY